MTATRPNKPRDHRVPAGGLRASRQTGVALILLVVLLSGCHTAPASPSPRADQNSVSARVATQLASLKVVPRPSADPSYRRAAFGPAWADTDHDGCSQRVNALAQGVDRSRPFTEVQRGRCRRDVIAGTWIDPYTGQAMTFTNVKTQQQAQQIPVDHAVALASVWRYGARDWTDKRRLEFATDLLNLQPTSRAVNSAKSDRDAAAWRPRKPFQCAYATRYIEVKAKYRLPVDRSEKASLTDMLTTCPAGPTYRRDEQAPGGPGRPAPGSVTGWDGHLGRST